MHIRQVIAEIPVAGAKMQTVCTKAAIDALGYLIISAEFAASRTKFVDMTGEQHDSQNAEQQDLVDDRFQMYFRKRGIDGRRIQLLFAD
ncbi:hypothetical protein HC352_00935 [Arcanobacterium buesumense]|uniref:Uncharacterized protein n=1 Tax=Arcanobacterium buesumense TaxID=2722751 RepID=A0A6H2EIU0_9ACTO|nr:hypothetical protein [Arcanobacterium buesumense]QJC21054.1 hypothetical protein HC352_00935 [Arcanobacterium buesumense]